MNMFIFISIIVSVIFIGIIMTQVPNKFIYAAKPVIKPRQNTVPAIKPRQNTVPAIKPRQNTVPGIPGLNMDQRTCPPRYVLDLLTNNCVKPPTGQGQGQGQGQAPPNCKPNEKRVGNKCVPNVQAPQECKPNEKRVGNKCVQAPKNCKPNEKKVGNNCVPNAQAPGGSKQCPQPNQIRHNNICVNMCMTNNRPGFINNGLCQAFNNSASGGPNNPLFNRPISSNCNPQTQFQDKGGKCLDMCVKNNVPGVFRDGQCRPFSNTMLGKGQGSGGRDNTQTGDAGNGQPRPPKPPKPPKPPIRPPTPINNLQITCPPGQVFENNICRVPQQGPPPQQKPVAFVPPPIPPQGCQPGQTCSSTLTFQGNNIPSYTYNGQTYIIKDVNGKPRPCKYMPNMNANGGFPCIDDYTVNFVNGQILPDNSFETAFS